MEWVVSVGWFGLVGWEKERLASADSVKKWSSGFVRYAMNIQTIPKKVFWKILSKKGNNAVLWWKSFKESYVFLGSFCVGFCFSLFLVGIPIPSHVSSQRPLHTQLFWKSFSPKNIIHIYILLVFPSCVHTKIAWRTTSERAQEVLTVSM